MSAIQESGPQPLNAAIVFLRKLSAPMRIVTTGAHR